jgi:hypothetical protein
LRKIEIQPIPDDAPQALESWSKPLGSVRIGSDVLYQRVGGSSLMAIGLLATLCGFGATLVVLNMPFADFCAFACACISMFFGLIVLGVGWRVFFRSPLLNFTAWIFEEGILLRRAGQSTATRWEEIDEFRVDGESGRFSYGLSLLDTEPIIVSMSQSPDIFPLMDYIEIRMASAQLLPRLKAIWDGDHERFGSVTLDREGFRVTKTFVLWSDVHYVIRLGNTLFFECHSRPQGISIRYRDVAFPYLVVALTRVLIAEHTRMKPPAA